MAKPGNEAKTAFGNRFRSVRKAVGTPDRSTVAKSIGVSKNSLAAYKRGENEPTASTWLRMSPIMAFVYSVLSPVKVKCFHQYNLIYRVHVF